MKGVQSGNEKLSWQIRLRAITVHKPVWRAVKHLEKCEDEVGKIDYA
jgi:hypothetical protein